jgi:hypothetical protein
MATEYKPRDEVPASGIYRVRHDRHHAEHEVTCVKGRRSSFNPIFSEVSFSEATPNARNIALKQAAHRFIV